MVSDNGAIRGRNASDPFGCHSGQLRNRDAQGLSHGVNRRNWNRNRHSNHSGDHYHKQLPEGTPVSETE